MAETVLNCSPLAPPIGPISPDDRRGARAAGGPPTAALTWSRRYGFGDEFASAVRAHRAPPPGGWCGALGAYQAGVYEALTEADLHPMDRRHLDRRHQWGADCR
jgi:hypothetical protein